MDLKNKKNLTNIGILVVVALGAFYLGMSYEKGQTPASTRGQFTGAGGQFGGARGARGNGMVAGDIIAKDATSITVQEQNGSSKIVLVGSGTQVSKMVSGSEADLAMGTSVIVSGAANSDGSVTATAVQIRPAGYAPVRAASSTN